jgi:hypothetical protein
MHSLDLHNPPRTGFMLVKLLIKKIRRREQFGTVNVKWAGTGFHSFVANSAPTHRSLPQQE